MSSNEAKPPAAAGGRATRRAHKLIPPIVVLALLGVLGWNAWPLFEPMREVSVVQAVFEPAPAAPNAASPDQPAASAGRAVQAPGWLEAEPFFVACSALADGVVNTIDVLEGDPVEAGDVVATLIAEDSELRVRRAEADLASAQALLEEARAEAEAAEARWREPVELERAVASTEAALTESEAELERLPSLIASAEATLVELEEQRERVRRSTERDAANEIELIVATQRAEAQRADLEALHASRPILEARVARLRSESRAAERDLSLRIEDRRRLSAARAGLALAEASAESARVALDEARLELARMTIRAPISGYVQSRLKVPGDKVIRMMDAPHSAHLVHLYDPSRIQVRVDVPLADAAHVSVGQRCEVVVEVLPDRVFAGEVLRITHQADLQKNTLQVKVKVIDPDPVLRPEMLTRVKFLAQTSPADTSDSARSELGAVRLPAAAVEKQDDGETVWRITERRRGRGSLTRTPVRVLERSESWVRVTGDLRPGDLIAIRPRGAAEGERVVIRSASPGEES